MRSVILLIIAATLCVAEIARAQESVDYQIAEAAGKGDANAVLTLLSQSPSKAAVNRALYEATLLEHQETALVLLKHGANGNHAGGPHNDTPLMNAAEKNNIEVVRACLRRGADPNLRCDHGWTALMHAVFGQHLELVKLLATHKGTRINAHDRYDFTALSMAADGGHVEIVKYLLTTRADPTVRNDRGKTALDLARQNVADPRSSDQLRKNSRAIARMLESKL